MQEQETPPLATTVSDVEARLDTQFDVSEHARVESLIEEATVLIEGYLGRPLTEPVPRAVRVVAARMVARVLEAPEGSGFNQESASYTSGPFSKSVKFVAGASGGSPWLTAADKMALRGAGGRGGIYTIGIG